jgi:hypothetical protein
MQNPTLIWQESITTAEDREFWPVEIWEDESWRMDNGPAEHEEDTNAGFRPDHRQVKRPRMESSTSTFVN